MSRALITLHCSGDRERAARWSMQAPIGTRIEFKDPKRSNPQNDRMWAMLTDVATQKQHCGRKYTPDQWKVLFMHGCGREVQFLPSLDSATFIPWGQSSSDLSTGEMTNLIEFIFAWGAENGVVFHEPSEKTLASADAGAGQVNAAAPPNSIREPSAPQPGPGSKPASEDVPPSDAGTTSSPEGSNSPGTGEAKQISGPGNTALHGSAGLPQGFLKAYAKGLGAATNKPKSLQNCHEKVLPLLGGEPSEDDLIELRAVYGLFKRHLAGELSGENLAADLREFGAI